MSEFTRSGFQERKKMLANEIVQWCVLIMLAANVAYLTRSKNDREKD